MAEIEFDLLLQHVMYEQIYHEHELVHIDIIFNGEIIIDQFHDELQPQHLLIQHDMVLEIIILQLCLFIIT